MRILPSIALSILLVLLAPLAWASELKDVRVWDGPESTRIVFDIEGATDHKFFTLANPDRLVIDIPTARKGTGLDLNALGKGMVKAVRTGPREGGLRVVVDLTQAVSPKSFGLEPNGSYGHRLIFDLFPKDGQAVQAVAQQKVEEKKHEVFLPLPADKTAKTAEKTTEKIVEKPTVKPVEKPAEIIVGSVSRKPAAPAEEAKPAGPPVNTPKDEVRRSVNPKNEKPIVIAIDAGHGGEDPGARGKNGVVEKDVTLRIAKKLAALVDATPGYKAVLTRKGDYFIALRGRTAIARQAQADLFVSIHANSLPTSRDIRGSAVYVLSARGATSEHAKMLANLENSADLVGGVDLSSKDDDLASVLLDISQSAVREASFDLGSRLLDSIGQVNQLQKPEVQQAGFAVLKSPDVPSVLVETAFLSHPEEERLLASPNFQETLAESLLNGIKGYFSAYRPQQSVQPQSVRAVKHPPETVAVSLKRRR
jgi:N-acetylmuramoyl-L-alanine amidase